MGIQFNNNAVEQWSDSNQLSLVHDAKHPPSFNSARWEAGYNPDIAFVNQTIGSLCKRGVLDPIPRTQHRPICVSVHAAVTPTIVPYQRRFNFQTADQTVLQPTSKTKSTISHQIQKITNFSTTWFKIWYGNIFLVAAELGMCHVSMKKV